MELDDTVIAYPYNALNEERYLNHEVGNEAVLVVFGAEAAVSIVFDRDVAGQTRTFLDTGDPFRMKDVETGTLWDAFTGEALEGELAGQQLQLIASLMLPQCCPTAVSSCLRTFFA